jgi:hypothetical protein
LPRLPEKMRFLIAGLYKLYFGNHHSVIRMIALVEGMASHHGLGLVGEASLISGHQ